PQPRLRRQSAGVRRLQRAGGRAARSRSGSAPARGRRIDPPRHRRRRRGDPPRTRRLQTARHLIALRNGRSEAPAGLNARGAVMALLSVLLLVFAQAAEARELPRPETFTLRNGLEVVVITDRRAPVVTHMVWYRVGAADEPRGRSG